MSGSEIIPYNHIKSALLGVTVGDALGVPVEFVSRRTLKMDPVTGMRAHGTHDQPAGTWSDDTALTLCLAETLCEDLNLEVLARHFIAWKQHGYWSAHGTVFDIGIATAAAIDRLGSGVKPVLAGGADEGSNGNGSLMRILPLVFVLADKDINTRYETVKAVSALTHRHPCSVIACFLYLEFALELLWGRDERTAFSSLKTTALPFLQSREDCPASELARFGRITGDPADIIKMPILPSLPAERISSSGYVLSTLEASLWCLLNTGNLEDAVLMAINLGEDSDTTGAVTGGLAGLLYGWQAIPDSWLQILARRDDIETLARRLFTRLSLNTL